MEIKDLITDVLMPIATIVLGGGWFIHYRANRRKANANALSEQSKALVDDVSAAEVIHQKYVEVIRQQGEVSMQEFSKLTDKLKEHIELDRTFQKSVDKFIGDSEEYRKKQMLINKRIELKLLLTNPALRSEEYIDEKYKEYTDDGGNSYICDLYKEFKEKRKTKK
ncbi:hypothetical protein [Dysgonomonas termitidis]|uniref:Phage protein n=1 Tax=Dysgonomonas termitidis TaxID=1516126 RepID=A0ABV9KQK9_9BACT